MRSILFIMLIFLSSFLYSQGISNYNKGNFIIGGTLNFSTSYLEFDAYDYWGSSSEIYHYEGRQKQLMIAPAGLYFVCNRLAIGLGVNYTKSWDSAQKNALSDKIILLESGPYIRVYFFKNSGIFLNTNYYTGKYFIKEYDILAENGYYKYNVNISHLNFGLGHSFFLNKNLSFDFQIKYSAEILNSNIEFVSDELIEQFKIFFGFVAFFNKTKE